MHDIRFIRDSPDAFDKGLQRRGLAPQSAEILDVDRRRRAAISESEGIQARRKALSQQIALLAHDGLLTVHADPCDARARLLTLTPKGVDAQHLVHRLFRQIEDDWAADLGVDGLAAFRRALLTLLARRPATGC